MLLLNMQWNSKEYLSDMSGVRTVQQVAQAIKKDTKYYESLSVANKEIVDAFAGTETSTEQ